MNKLEVGQRIEASITRSGGKTIKITGEVAKIEKAFGREDIVVKSGNAEQFTVNRKNVKALKTSLK